MKIDNSYLKDFFDEGINKEQEPINLLEFICED